MIENGRAAFAFDSVEKDMAKLSDNKEEYRSYIKRMPMMIKVNGLGQTLAFYYSKGGTHRIIYNNLAKWINEYYADELGLSKEDKKKEFVDMIVHMDSDRYRMATAEILNVLNWMRRFVDGMIKNGEMNNGE